MNNKVVEYIENSISPGVDKSDIPNIISGTIRYIDSLGNIEIVDISKFILDTIVGLVDDDLAIFVRTFGPSVIELLLDIAKDPKLFFKSRCCIKKRRTTHTSMWRASRTTLGNAVVEYDSLLEYMKIKLHKPCNKKKILDIIVSSIKFVDRFRELSGSEKKDIVIRGIVETIENSTLIEQEVKNDILDFIDNVSDSLINSFVSLGRQRFSNLHR